LSAESRDVVNDCWVVGTENDDAHAAPIVRDEFRERRAKAGEIRQRRKVNRTTPAALEQFKVSNPAVTPGASRGEGARDDESARHGVT
jgi:hypothetical protein